MERKRIAIEEQERKLREEIATEEAEKKRQEEIAAANAHRIASEEAERNRIARNLRVEIATEIKRQEEIAAANAHRIATEEAERNRIAREERERIAAEHELELQRKRKEETGRQEKELAEATRQKAFEATFAESVRMRAEESKRRQDVAAVYPTAHENERKKKEEEIAAATLRNATQKEEQRMRQEAAEQANGGIATGTRRKRLKAKAAKAHQDAVEVAKSKFLGSSPPAGTRIEFIGDQAAAQTNEEGANTRLRRITARSVFSTNEVKEFFAQSTPVVDEGPRRSSRVQAKKRQQDPKDAENAQPRKFLEVSRDDQVSHSANNDSEKGCVCGRTHSTTMDRNLFWILCGTCDKWHHVDKTCIGFSKSQAEVMEWNCPECTKKEEQNSGNDKSN